MSLYNLLFGGMIEKFIKEVFNEPCKFEEG